MIENQLDTDDLRRMVDAEPMHHGAPDLVALRTAGRRALLRRRAVTGVVAFAAAAAIAAPAYVVAAGGTGESAGRMPSAAESPGMTDGLPAAPECGEFSCVDEGSVERAPVVGEPWAIGELAGGVEEVLYVARHDSADVVMAGTRDGETLRRTVWALQPGTDGEIAMWTTSNADGTPQFSVLGYVAGAPEQITWSAPDGEKGAVTETTPALLTGYTLFHLTLPLPEGFKPGSYEKTEGGIQINPGDAFVPQLTIRTSDGASCSFADCGSIG